MKAIRIKKSKQFSANSKVMIHVGPNKILIKGYDFYTTKLEEEDKIFASHLWTKSEILNYDQLDDNGTIQIVPRMGKIFAIVILIVLGCCTVFFFLYKSRWSFIPLVPFVLYILLYITVLKDKYLLLKKNSE